MRIPIWLLPVVLVVTTLVYLPGLPGPFVFDDNVHITRNAQVHITDLSLDSLAQAWNSSLATGLGKRPLAQLTFGINHALTGLDPWFFKATNLTLHLLTGLLIYALSRGLTAALARRPDAPTTASNPWPALLVTSFWLLHPINLTPVLYAVQRMTGLSSLFVVAALLCHVAGRLRMADGDRRGFWLALAGLPLAAFGGLAKESAALYPLLVAALEWTLLRHLIAPRRNLLLGVVVAIPIVIGAAYLLTHLGLLGYGGRDFTLEQRLLSEARVLWFYLRLVLLPDPTALGFYHDDIAVSADLLTPWTTLPAVLGWLVAMPAAMLNARRFPVASFAVLFFLAGHAMESTVIPLELVFEHRNYLAVFGPLFALSWWLMTLTVSRWQLAGPVLAMLVIAAMAAVTHLRALDWSDIDRLLLSEVRHHPDSPRANFRTAQLLIDALPSSSDPKQVYLAARYHLTHALDLAPSNLNARFGLLFLDLQVGRTPPPALLDDLVRQLREGLLGPTKLSVGQFDYLVRWQMAGGRNLPHEAALAILSAPLENPRASSQVQAAALSALRAYYDRVLNDPERAVDYAKRAVQAWPQSWHYHYRLIQLLLRLGRNQDARAAFEEALHYPSAALNPGQRNELATALNQAQPQRDKIR